jgi:hypothetical protein
MATGFCGSSGTASDGGCGGAAADAWLRMLARWPCAMAAAMGTDDTEMRRQSVRGGRLTMTDGRARGLRVFGGVYATDPAPVRTCTLPSDVPSSRQWPKWCAHHVTAQWSPPPPGSGTVLSTL